jgi:hypothetical protein
VRKKADGVGEMSGPRQRVQELRRRRIGREQWLRLGAQLEQPADLRRARGGDLLQRTRDYGEPPCCGPGRGGILN